VSIHSFIGTLKAEKTTNLCTRSFPAWGDVKRNWSPETNMESVNHKPQKGRSRSCQCGQLPGSKGDGVEDVEESRQNARGPRSEEKGRASATENGSTSGSSSGTTAQRTECAAVSRGTANSSLKWSRLSRVSSRQK